MLTNNQKIAIGAIVVVALISFLSPIVYYKYKINTCASAQVERYRSQGVMTEDSHDLEYLCHALVNGATSANL